MLRFLVTGAAGFIGSHLVSYLLDQGHDVVALDNFSQGSETNLSFVDSHSNKAHYRFIQADIRSLKDCQLACKNVDYVLHQAALGSVPRSMEEPVLYADNNIMGTLNMLMAAREHGVKRFVFASSSSVYGDTPTLPKEECMPLLSRSPYAVTKATGELYCRQFYQSFGLETIVLRYFNVFGPRQNPNSQYAAAVPKFVTAFLSGERPVIYGDGEQTRDFTYIDNVIQANANGCLVAKEGFGEPINVGCGDRISINDLVQTIQSVLCSDIQPRYEETRVGDVRDSMAQIDRLKDYLQCASLVSLSEGLEKTISWYQ